MTSILLLEDDLDLMEELSDCLTALGYTVHTASTVTQAENLLVEAYDMLVLDINLPDGNGLDLCRRMRPYIRSGIIMFTGRSERELRIQGLKDGADAFLVKPVDPEELEATLISVRRRLSSTKTETPWHATRPIPVQWRLDRTRHALTGPNSKVCKLSEGEALLLAALLTASNQQATRETLVAEFHHHDKSLNGRHIETLVSRLRGKVLTEIGLQLPVESVYGKGYVFSDHAQVV
jgi:DNA-binding response OmpR family regulator